jgi:hypothetical protein
MLLLKTILLLVGFVRVSKPMAATTFVAFLVLGSVIATFTNRTSSPLLPPIQQEEVGEKEKEDNPPPIQTASGSKGPLNPCETEIDEFLDDLEEFVKVQPSRLDGYLWWDQRMAKWAKKLHKRCKGEMEKAFPDLPWEVLKLKPGKGWPNWRKPEYRPNKMIRPQWPTD